MGLPNPFPRRETCLDANCLSDKNSSWAASKQAIYNRISSIINPSMIKETLNEIVPMGWPLGAISSSLSGLKQGRSVGQKSIVCPQETSQVPTINQGGRSKRPRLKMAFPSPYSRYNKVQITNCCNAVLTFFFG